VIGDGVVLGARVGEGQARAVGRGEGRREDAQQEAVLQLAHVGVETPVGVAVTLDVEDEHPLSAGLRCLRLVSRASMRRFRKGVRIPPFAPGSPWDHAARSRKAHGAGEVGADTFCGNLRALVECRL
jgi:hypothetical protein